MLATCHGRAEVKGLPPLDVVIQKRHATIHVCSFNILKALENTLSLFLGNEVAIKILIFKFVQHETTKGLQCFLVLLALELTG